MRFSLIQIVNNAAASIDNCYKIRNLKFTGIRCRTNMAPNTAFRGFGSPQAILIMEEAIFRIACELNVAPEMVTIFYYIRGQMRKNNFKH